MAEVCCGWIKEEYIKDRTQYWIDGFPRGRLKDKREAAILCAIDDWERLVEKYGLTEQ